ncbi:MAG: hypothetical protein ACYDCW_07735 [Acidithiobacillus ferrivorans]
MDISIIDTCLADYFPGCDAPYIQIGIWKGMTRSEVTGAISSAIDDESFEVPAWTEDQYNELRHLVDARMTNWLLTASRNLPSDEERGMTDTVYCYVRIIL